VNGDSRPQTDRVSALQRIASEVRAFASTFPVEACRVWVDEGEDRLVTSVTVADEAAFEHGVRARFGDAVDLYFDVYERSPSPLGTWQVLPDGRTIKATWVGSGADPELEAAEVDNEIHLTATTVQWLGARRAAGGRGRPMKHGSTGEGYDLSASVTLRGAVGRRRILDDQRDRIDDHPPVRRSLRRRLGQSMLGIRVWDWVDKLDWAECQGCEGPGENGWIRIYATVDDTERLRAAIVKKFGPGFEVEYQAPSYPSSDED
jgi:hypothetical protein